MRFKPFAVSLTLALIGSATLAAKAQQPATPKTINLWKTTGAQIFCDPDASSKSVCVNSTSWKLADGTTIRVLEIAKP
jgi:invasion protein IalB